MQDFSEISLNAEVNNIKESVFLKNKSRYTDGYWMTFSSDRDRSSYLTRSAFITQTNLIQESIYTVP